LYAFAELLVLVQSLGQSSRGKYLTFSNTCILNLCILEHHSHETAATTWVYFQCKSLRLRPGFTNAGEL